MIPVVAGLLAWAAGELAGSFVGSVITEVFGASPEGDARKFPFSRDENCPTPVYADQGQAGTHPEYQEAYTRLKSLISIAERCTNIDPAELAKLRKAIGSALSAGVYQHTAGALSPAPTGAVYYTCESAERPTRGQVRAWLSTLATTLGTQCIDGHSTALAEAAAEARQPLDQPIAPRPNYWPAVLIAGAAAAAIWWLS